MPVFPGINLIPKLSSSKLTFRDYSHVKPFGQLRALLDYVFDADFSKTTPEEYLIRGRKSKFEITKVLQNKQPLAKMIEPLNVHYTVDPTHKITNIDALVARMAFKSS